MAVLDVHICRACEACGIFPRGTDPSRNYLQLEERFLELARALRIRAGVLDNLMWKTMRQLAPIVGSSWLRLTESTI